MSRDTEETEPVSPYHKADVSSAKRLAFVGEWFQDQAGTVKSFVVCFYPADKSLEIFDQRTKQMFLRRTMVTGITERDFYIGAKVTILGRVFRILGYGNEITRTLLDKYRKKCFIMLMSPIFPKLGDFITDLIYSGFELTRGKMVKLTNEQVHGFFEPKDMNCPDLVHHMMGDSIVALELLSNDALEKMRAAREQLTHLSNGAPIPTRLIDIFKDPSVPDLVYLPENETEMCRDIKFFFIEPNIKVQAYINNSTLCVIKPHCIKDGVVGKIIQDIINAGYKVISMVFHSLERENAAEFLEIYDTILPDYNQFVNQLCSGLSIALEVSPTEPKEDFFEDFRTLCGPIDPEVAKVLRPETLRAKYGHSRSMNAVHCTDLKRDIRSELEYMFEIVGLPPC